MAFIKARLITYGYYPDSDNIQSTSVEDDRRIQVRADGRATVSWCGSQRSVEKDERNENTYILRIKPKRIAAMSGREFLDRIMNSVKK